MAPVSVGGQRQHADDPAEPVVGAPGMEERAVAAIVLDHEQADQETGRGHRQQQGQPVADAKAEPHRQPERRERCRRQRELGQARRGIGLPVGCEYLVQSRRMMGWVDGSGARRTVSIATNMAARVALLCA